MLKILKAFLKNWAILMIKFFMIFLGKESINLGLYGVPETFFVNKDGKILYKHVGPINQQEFKKIISRYFKLG